MYNVCDRHPLVCVSRLMVALQLYIIQQRVSLVCAKFRICSFIVVYIFFIFCLYITRVKSSKNLLTQTSFYITALFHNIQDLKGFHFLFHIAMQISAQQPLQLVQDILVYCESIQLFRL